MKSRLLASGMICLWLTSCQQSPDYGGHSIESTGRFPCFKNQLLVDVEAASDGRLKYRMQRRNAAFRPKDPSLKATSHWVILPESQDSVWVYDGEHDVTRIEFYEDGGAKFTSQQKVPDLLSKAPAEFVSRLPADLKSS